MNNTILPPQTYTNKTDTCRLLLPKVKTFLELKASEMNLYFESQKEEVNYTMAFGICLDN